MPPSEEKFLLKDHLFNREKTGYLAGLFGLSSRWVDKVTAGFPERELKERIDWIADCLERELPSDFNEMANSIEAALPPPLDPTKTDDDFGDFIFAPLGVLAARHGLATPERGLDLIETLTQQVSMEFAVRDFLNAHQDLTLKRMEDWCTHSSYHVRRLVSEGTRARLPWAPKIALDPMRPLDLLDRLHADPTRYVTRSVANHIGDIAKIDVSVACDRLELWRAQARQGTDELEWMIRHALRAQIKAGAPEAMRCIGVAPGAPVADVAISVSPKEVPINTKGNFDVSLTSEQAGTLVIDYEITFATASGKPRAKVFKLKTLEVEAAQRMSLTKAHFFKGGATTFALHPGPHRFTLLVNGAERGSIDFALT